ncbi:DUF370 domain-containing protein [Thermotoga sp. KOL6]|uniref:DUF370 domain-containing protein n=1 Tax=Thermotoga sp. KOL6 TaxID=126741 RepID=UPI000C77F20A|nr:DUF370 domain-containing protein [Thermotoga sp. KOL6]PLV58747.1 hypothetical protein AS005_07650 [Thermotoga sp. KOL6]
MSFVSFGRKVFLPRERVMAVMPVSAVVAKKIKDVDFYANKIINATFGKQAKTAVVMDSGHVILIPTRYKIAVRAIWGRRKK